MKIGLISDTHGFLDPQVGRLFSEVEHILHAGDIGSPAIILELEGIAPVTAVLGNTDVGLDFPETEVVQVSGRKFLVHHIVDVHQPHDALKRRIAKETPDVVVFGHSHRPHCETVGRTLYLNPGYAGKQRFDLPRSVAILHCDGAQMHTEFLPIGPAP